MTYLCAVKAKRRENKNVKGIATLNLIVIFGFIILSGAYLIATDNLIGKSYQLREFEARARQGREFAKKLENQQAERSALYNLQQAAKELNLVTIDKVKYLDAIDSSVALMK